jgi:hypothetical protein
VRLRRSQDDRVTGRQHFIDVEAGCWAFGQLSLPA